MAESQVSWLEPSGTERGDVEAAAEGLPFALPPSVIDYLTAPTVPGVEWNEIAVPTNKAPEALLALMKRSELWPIQLAQVGTGPNDDPVCLDLSRPMYDGEYPVLVICRARVPDDGWNDAKTVRKFVSLEFSDFGVMLHFCCHGVPLEFRKKFGK